MAIRTVVTRGYGNGTFNGTIPLVVLRGYAGGVPVFSGTIPDITLPQSTTTTDYDLSTYFTGAVSYAIAPSVETSWTFNTSTAVLTILPDTAGAYGPYVVTATNPAGTADSNGFNVTVTESGATGGWWFTYDQELEQRTAQRKKRAKLEEEAEKIQEKLDRELVKELQSKAREQERVDELRRLSKLAEQHKQEISEVLSGKVLLAAERAIKKGSYSAMEQFERELARAKEEEEFLMMAVNIIMESQ